MKLHAYKIKAAREILELHRGVLATAAAHLGVNEGTLRRWIQKHDELAKFRRSKAASQPGQETKERT